jgi:O-antigen/teichoic acid export membrane protein
MTTDFRSRTGAEPADTSTDVPAPGAAEQPPEDEAPAVMLEGPLTASQIKSRAAAGVAMLLGRSILFRILSFVGSLALARLLTPDDFGVVAIGLTLVNFGQFLANSGIGEGLMTRREPPTRDELKAVTGFQLSVATAVGGIAAGVAIAALQDGVVTAFMMLALPLTAYRTPAMLTLQRRLAFGSTVTVEIVETIVYLSFAIGGAAAGLGAWSLAGGTVLRYGVGTIVAVVLSGAGFLVPNLVLSRLRRIIGFGIKFQAAAVVQTCQDLLLTTGILVIAGVSALGLWSFAARFLQVPFMVFEAMFSVGFPALSRLMRADDRGEVRHLIERSVSATSVGVSCLSAPLVASSPALVPLLFGDKWSDVSLILPGCAIALAVYGPIAITAYAYLYAAGDASTTLIGSVIGAVVRLVATFALLPILGIGAIGLGWAIGALAEMPWVTFRLRARSGADLGWRVLRPSACGCAAGLLGWEIATAMGTTYLSAALAIALTVAALAVLLLAFARRDLHEAHITLRRTLVEARSR